MVDFKLILEIEHLDKAVDAFAAEMKKQLAAKAKEGKRGWNQPTLSERYVVRQLWDDATSLEQALACETVLPVTVSPQLVDIANRAAILWARRNQNAVQQTQETKTNAR